MREERQLDGCLVQTRLPKGPSGFSYFCFCSPVPGPGDRDRDRNQLQPLLTLEELPAWGGRGASSLSDSTWGLSWGPAGCRAERPWSLAPGGGWGAARPRQECWLRSRKLLEEVELTRIRRSFSQFLSPSPSSMGLEVPSCLQVITLDRKPSNL